MWAARGAEGTRLDQDEMMKPRMYVTSWFVCMRDGVNGSFGVISLDCVV